MKRILMIAIAALMVAGCSSNKSNGQTATVTTLKVEEFAQVIKQRKVRLIDVRTPKEFADGHLKGAENIDIKSADFGERTKEVKGRVAVYCLRGGRSLKAAKQLAAQGCTVYNLDGGILAWKQAGQPVTQ